MMLFDNGSPSFADLYQNSILNSSLTDPRVDCRDQSLQFSSLELRRVYKSFFSVSTLNIASRVFGFRSFIEADWYFSHSWKYRVVINEKL